MVQVRVRQRGVSTVVPCSTWSSVAPGRPARRLAVCAPLLDQPLQRGVDRRVARRRSVVPTVRQSATRQSSPRATKTVACPAHRGTRDGRQAGPPEVARDPVGPIPVERQVAVAGPVRQVYRLALRSLRSQRVAMTPECPSQDISGLSLETLVVIRCSIAGVMSGPADRRREPGSVGVRPARSEGQGVAVTRLPGRWCSCLGS